MVPAVMNLRIYRLLMRFCRRKAVRDTCFMVRREDALPLCEGEINPTALCTRYYGGRGLRDLIRDCYAAHGALPSNHEGTEKAAAKRVGSGVRALIHLEKYINPMIDGLQLRRTVNQHNVDRIDFPIGDVVYHSLSDQRVVVIEWEHVCSRKSWALKALGPNAGDRILQPFYFVLPHSLSENALKAGPMYVPQDELTPAKNSPADSWTATHDGSSSSPTPTQATSFLTKFSQSVGHSQGASDMWSSPNTTNPSMKHGAPAEEHACSQDVAGNTSVCPVFHVHMTKDASREGSGTILDTQTEDTAMQKKIYTSSEVHEHNGAEISKYIHREDRRARGEYFGVKNSARGVSDHSGDLAFPISNPSLREFFEGYCCERHRFVPLPHLRYEFPDPRYPATYSVPI
eukprot:Rmarinus@m.18134